MPGTTPTPFFSWVIPNLLAALGLPSMTYEVKYLKEVGIKQVVILMKECNPPIKRVQISTGLPLKSFVCDCTPRTVEQVQGSV